jgi:hypothetical protein
VISCLSPQCRCGHRSYKYAAIAEDREGRRRLPAIPALARRPSFPCAFGCGRLGFGTSRRGGGGIAVCASSSTAPPAAPGFRGLLNASIQTLICSFNWFLHALVLGWVCPLPCTFGRFLFPDSHVDAYVFDAFQQSLQFAVCVTKFRRTQIIRGSFGKEHVGNYGSSFLGAVAFFRKGGTLPSASINAHRTSDK